MSTTKKGMLSVAVLAVFAMMSSATYAGNRTKGWVLDRPDGYHAMTQNPDGSIEDHGTYQSKRAAKKASKAAATEENQSNNNNSGGSGYMAGPDGQGDAR